MSGTAAPTRLHHLDFLRAALMLLGIPYHAALPYSTTEWNISSEEDSWVFTAFADFVHLWRMPTFFVIAGYFALLILRRRGTREWLTGRFKRLGIPFLFGVILVVPAQWFIQLWTRTDDSGAAADLWIQRMTTQIPSISHLWFLLDLLVYCCLLAIVFSSRVRHRIGALAERATAKARRSAAFTFILALAATAVTVAALVVWDLLDVSAMTGDIFTSNLVRNLPFFVFGAALALRPNYVVQVSSRPHGVTVAIAVTSAVLLVVSETLGLLESRIGSVVEAVLLTVGAFYWARLLLAIANRVLDGPKPAVEWLVDSALVIYIFHHPLVILYSHLVIQADAPPWLGFTLVTLLAFASAALIYELIALVPVLRFVTSGFSRKSKTLLGISQQRLRREATTAESS